MHVVKYRPLVTVFAVVASALVGCQLMAAKEPAPPKGPLRFRVFSVTVEGDLLHRPFGRPSPGQPVNLSLKTNIHCALGDEPHACAKIGVEIEAVVHTPSGAVSRSHVVARAMNDDIYPLEVNDVGAYRVELVHGEQVVAATAVLVAEVPCAGMQHMRYVWWPDGTVQDGDDESSELQLRRLEPMDQNPAFRVEWWRDGAMVHRDEGRHDYLSALRQTIENMWTSTDEASGAESFCPWTTDGEAYRIPAEVATRPGSWQARVWREGQPAIAIQFVLDARGRAIIDLDDPKPVFTMTRLTDGGEGLTSIPALRPGPRPSDGRLMATFEEVRALTRSAALFQQRQHYNYLMGGVGGVLIGDHLSDEERRRLSPEQRFRTNQSRERAATAEDAAATQRQRAKARKMEPALRRAISESSAPWSPSELPPSPPAD